MRKYLPAFACAVVGFILMGPIGSIVGVAVYWLMNRGIAAMPTKK